MYDIGLLRLLEVIKVRLYQGISGAGSECTGRAGSASVELGGVHHWRLRLGFIRVYQGYQGYQGYHKNEYKYS